MFVYNLINTIYFSQSPLLSLPPIYSTSPSSPDYYIFRITSILSKSSYPLFSISAPIRLLPCFLTIQNRDHHNKIIVSFFPISTQPSSPLFSLSTLPSNPLLPSSPYQHFPLLPSSLSSLYQHFPLLSLLSTNTFLFSLFSLSTLPSSLSSLYQHSPPLSLSPLSTSPLLQSKINICLYPFSLIIPPPL